MFKKKRVVRPIEEETTVSILCNLCEREMLTECSPEGNGVYIDYEGGYDSYVFGDGVKVNFHLCENCLNDLTVRCKIKPSIKDRYRGQDERKQK
jgi:hypothetical protein